MNSSTPSPSPAPQPQRPRLVVPRFNRRDIVIGLLIALVVIAFIVAAVWQSTKTPENLLKGVIRVKNEPGLKETLMTVSTKGVKERTADTGYSVKVWVESQKREYEVMIAKELWEKKKVGDELVFTKPPNEQR